MVKLGDPFGVSGKQQVAHSGVHGAPGKGWVVDQSPCAFWGHGQPPGALGMAERETAVKAGWGPDGSEVGENACVMDLLVEMPGLFLLLLLMLQGPSVFLGEPELTPSRARWPSWG